MPCKTTLNNFKNPYIMKTLTSTTVNKVIADFNKLSRSPIEREMFKSLLKYGFVTTVDRTDKIVSICQALGISVEKGNNAPRGGKYGNYVQNNNDELLTKSVTLNVRLSLIKKAKETRLYQEASERRTEQYNFLKDYFVSNPEFYDKIKHRIENFSSKEWRNWVKMKVAGIFDGFSKVELSPADIRNILYSIEK